MKKRVALINNLGQWVLITDQKYIDTLRPKGNFESDFEKKIFFGLVEDQLLLQIIRDKDSKSPWAIPTIVGMIMSQALVQFSWLNKDEGETVCAILNPDLNAVFG